MKKQIFDKFSKETVDAKFHAVDKQLVPCQSSSSSSLRCKVYPLLQNPTQQLGLYVALTRFEQEEEGVSETLAMKGP